MIEESARAFLQQLSPLIPSPRSAERLVNIYRFIRAPPLTCSGSSAAAAGCRANTRPVALPLAILTGFPTQAAEFFRALNAAGTQGTNWWELCDRYSGESRRGGSSSGPRSRRCGGRWRWTTRWSPSCAGPRTSARFSFQTGQIFARRHG